MARFDKLELESKTAQRPRQALKTESTHEQLAWLDQAIEERRCGHYENALRLYSRALEDDKSLVIGWLGQVQMLILLGESVEAELWSRKALELFPGNGDLLAGRAQAMRRSSDVKQAMNLSDGSLKAPGQSAYRWLVRGELMVATEQATDRHCFDKAAQADKDWLVLLEIARVYLELGYPSRALVRIRKAVELAPSRYYAWYVQGQIELGLGLEAAARKSWQHCLELCPMHENAERDLRDLDHGGWSFRRLWRRVFGNQS